MKELQFFRISLHIYKLQLKYTITLPVDEIRSMQINSVSFFIKFKIYLHNIIYNFNVIALFQLSSI